MARFFPLMPGCVGRVFTIVPRSSAWRRVVDVSGRVGSNIPHAVVSRAFSSEDWLVMNEEAERVNRKNVMT